MIGTELKVITPAATNVLGPELGRRSVMPKRRSGKGGKMGSKPKKSTEEAEYLKMSWYTHRYPGFKGTLEFDMTFAFLGKRVTRKARVDYIRTPEWEYFDLNKQAPHVGLDSARYHLEIAAVPEEHHDDGTMTLGMPYWVKMGDITENDVLPHEMWDAVIDAIDEKCKAEDAERRKTAGRNR